MTSRARSWAPWVGLLLLAGCTATPRTVTPEAAPVPSPAPVSSAAPVTPPARPSSAPPSSPPAVRTVQDSGDPFDLERAPGLDDPYLACARDRGFDPEWAEVVADRAGRAVLVKTGYEVPAGVHGPCLVLLGGRDPGTTSYGRAPRT